MEIHPPNSGTPTEGTIEGTSKSPKGQEGEGAFTLSSEQTKDTKFLPLDLTWCSNLKNLI